MATDTKLPAVLRGPEANMATDIKLPAKLHGPEVPAAVTVEIAGGDTFSMPLADVDASALAAWLDDYRARVFQAAGRSDPAKMGVVRGAIHGPAYFAGLARHPAPPEND